VRAGVILHLRGAEFLVEKRDDFLQPHPASPVNPPNPVNPV
jgi:hypothetical protein